MSYGIPTTAGVLYGEIDFTQTPEAGNTLNVLTAPSGCVQKAMKCSTEEIKQVFHYIYRI